MSLTACEDKPAQSISSTEQVQEQSVPQTTMEEFKPDIQEKDMEGKEIKILTAGWGDYKPFLISDIAPEDENSEVLNDAAYRRKVDIEQQYNCRIVHISEADPNKATDSLRKSVLTQDGAYDLAVMRGINFTALVTSGSLLELGELPYVDIEKPWWKKQFYDALGIGGKHFGMCGDISTNGMMAVWTVCFNKKMVEDHSMTSPYELVRNGEWTFDKAVEMAKQVSGDTDGDGAMTVEDTWGINYTSDTVIGILNASGISIASVDDDGGVEIEIHRLENSVKIQNILEKLSDKTYCVDTLSDLNLPGQDGLILGAGRALFLFAATHNVNELKQMDTDFGIIPYPKYDKSQADYMPSTAGIFLSIVCVPKTNTDLENTGIFMEAFAYEGSGTVVPAFYETILKNKMARDNDSVEMLEYIYGNIGFDTGNLYNIGEMASKVGALSSKKDTNITSFLEKNMPVIESAIKKITDEISKAS